MLTKRTSLAIAVTSFIQSGCFIPAHYWLPVWFQTVREKDPLHSGLLLLPLTLSQLMGCLVGGALVQRFPYYLPEVIAGNAFAAIGVGLTTTFTVNIGLPKIVGYQALMGFGRGMVMQLVRVPLCAS
jgi:cyanate permease